MNLKTISMAVGVALLSLAGSGCAFFDFFQSTQNCYYDAWGYYICEVVYYNGDGTTDTSRDLITDIARTEQEVLAAQGKHFAEKFSLSIEKGTQIAKTVADFNTTQNRSEADIADFAHRLYGVNPSTLVSAFGKAQAGDNRELNRALAQAAENFSTSVDNMKSIVKVLHGKALEQQGVRF